MPNIIEITDLRQPELAAYTALTEAQLRNRLEPEQGIFIAESPKVIELALAAGYEPESFLMERRHIAGDARKLLSQCDQIPVYTAQREVLAQLTGYALTRGVLCAMRRPMLPEAETLCAKARRVAVLEDIVDAANLGAIFRSAAALGIDAVLVTPSCCDPLNRRAVRVSMGTVFQVPWGYAVTKREQWPRPGIDWLRAQGFVTAAMALCENAVSIEEETLKKAQKLAIVLGTEGTGLMAQTIAACDYTVKIPMSHQVDSLNVAAAAAVTFWQLRAE